MKPGLRAPRCSRPGRPAKVPAEHSAQVQVSWDSARPVACGRFPPTPLGGPGEQTGSSWCSMKPFIDIQNIYIGMGNCQVRGLPLSYEGVSGLPFFLAKQLVVGFEIWWVLCVLCTLGTEWLIAGVLAFGGIYKRSWTNSGVQYLQSSAGKKPHSSIELGKCIVSHLRDRLLWTEASSATVRLSHPPPAGILQSCRQGGSVRCCALLGPKSNTKKEHGSGAGLGMCYTFGLQAPVSYPTVLSQQIHATPA